jgi:DNA-nicking Smr family endonuclease
VAELPSAADPPDGFNYPHDFVRVVELGLTTLEVWPILQGPILHRRPNGRTHDGPVKLKLDLHDIYNRGDEIERALRSIMDEAVAKKAPLVEIVPGKGSGQLKKRVLRFLDRKEIKALYHRVEKDSDNFGRVFVHFRWK